MQKQKASNHVCGKCGVEKARDQFHAKAHFWWCFECIARAHGTPNPCECLDCQWHAQTPPLQRWRIQACEHLGISPAGAKLMDVAKQLAELHGDPVPACTGRAWSYLAERYVP